MTFANALRTEKFPRDEHVDIHVRQVALNSSAPPSARLPVVEIREFIKESGVYGHGIILPLNSVSDLVTALGRVSKDRE